MTRWPSPERFLKTDPKDVGCAETFERLHRHVERELTRGDAGARYRGSPPIFRPAIPASRISTGCWPPLLTLQAEQYRPIELAERLKHRWSFEIASWGITSDSERRCGRTGCWR